jgi:hypothetical protein
MVPDSPRRELREGLDSEAPLRQGLSQSMQRLVTAERVLVQVRRPHPDRPCTRLRPETGTALT